MPRDGDKIGLAAKPVRQKRARRITTPKADTPASANIPPADSGVAGGEGHACYGTQSTVALAETVQRLVALQKNRLFSIKQQSRADRSIEAILASAMGYRIDMSEKDKKSAFARAKAFRLSVEKAGEGQDRCDTHCDHALSDFIPLIKSSATGRNQWDDIRINAEAEMRKLAKSLPTHAFAKTVLGLKDGLAHAAIWANARVPLTEYRTVSGLWKRMGLAVIGGERQRKKSNAEDAEAHGYSASRRADVWAFCSDSMFRAQWRGVDDETGELAHAIGPYGEVYARRRAYTAPRVGATADLPSGHPEKWTLGRCHNDGRRMMTKALLRDLWRVAHGLPPRF